MRTAQVEEITGYFSDGLITVTDPGPLRGPIKGVKLRRNKKGDLILTTVTDGWPNDDRRGYPAGTVRQSTETVSFQRLGGAVGLARGVVSHGHSSRHHAGQSAETVEKSSLHSIELDFRRKEPSVYLIEWIDNVCEDTLCPDMIDYKTGKQSTEVLCPGQNPLTILGSEELSGGGRAAMRLVIGGTELFLTKLRRKGRKTRLGRIVYRSCPDQLFRDKVRDCLSFVLGLPIVYYGHTEFCTDWIPTKARSIDAFSIGGAMFRLYEQPPFPVCDARFGRMFDSRAVEGITNGLFERYDALGFRDLSWSYWHAMCAPIHIAAAYFGAVIEQFQRASSEVIQASRKGMLADDSWKTLRATMRAALDTADIPKELKLILKNKVDGLNQAPQGVMLKRLFDGLGLTLGDVESQAWRHRNMAAHGHLPKDHIEVILNAKVLRVLFHRILGGVTYCSDAYVDYYNLNFPARPLAEPVPRRT